MENNCSLRIGVLAQNCWDLPRLGTEQALNENPESITKGSFFKDVVGSGRRGVIAPPRI